MNKMIDLHTSEQSQSWYSDGSLFIRIGFVTLNLDKRMARELFVALVNTNDKMNELGIELEEWDATS